MQRQAAMHAHVQPHPQAHARPHAQPRVHVFHPRRHRTIEHFIHTACDRFLLLPIGAVIAVVWANTAPESYFLFSQRLAFPVNEIGMTFFFALLAQEVVEALMPGGALHSWRKWSTPIVAAIGAIVGASGVYLIYLHYDYEHILFPAWPIACAIDAAATYYVLRTIMPRSGALPFALVIAIVSDLFGMFMVVPRRFILETKIGGVTLMSAALLLAVMFRALKVRAFWPYLVFCGAMSWVAFYWDGLHPAFALVPIVLFLPHEPRKLDLFADPADDDAVHHAEHEWHLFIQPVLFLFGLVNAGISLRAYEGGSWAILTAALVGRPLGLLIGIQLARFAGLHLPRHMGWRELLVIAFATSSGISMALFFATGLIPPGPVLSEIKFGILASAVGMGLAFASARMLRVGRFNGGFNR